MEAGASVIAAIITIAMFVFGVMFIGRLFTAAGNYNKDHRKP